MQKYLQKHSDEEIAQWGEDLIVNKLSLTKISIKYNVPYKTVCNMLLKYGYRKKSKSYPTKVVPPLTYFDNIDTAEKAYLLGFLYTDGYICKTPYGEQ